MEKNGDGLGNSALYREEVVRRVVRRIAHVLQLDDFGDRLDLSQSQQTDSWEINIFRNGCRQLGVYTKQLESLSPTQALDIVREGHVVVIPRTDGSYTILERHVGRNVEITLVDGTQRHLTIPQSEVADLLADSNSGVYMAQRELACASLATHGDDPHSHLPPLRRFIGLLRLESNDIWTVVLFALVSGVMALATPLAVESLVNVVSWGTYVQPLAVLALILLACLGLAGVLKILQTVVVEIIQRRQFVRIVGDLAHRFPRAKRSFLAKYYPRELANRVFDIMTIQKATAVLLLDGVSLVLTTFLGLLLLAFYHPFLLGFNIVLLMAMISIIWLLGRGGIRTSIDESIAKYEIVHWLQDVISFPGAFKINGGEDLAIEKANNLAAEYLSARESQFRVVIRQVTFAIGLQVAASTALLGLGGWLVIGGQLTLGQLVASELVVTVVVGAFAKAGKTLEKFYDLMAGIDKVGHLLDIPVDGRRGEMLSDTQPASLEWTDLQLSNGSNQCQVAAGSLEPGKTLALTGNNVNGKSMFVDAVAGMADPPGGVVTIAEMDAVKAASAGRGRLVAVANRIEVFHGSVEENVELGRGGIGHDRVREVLKAVGLWNDIHRLPDGVETVLATDGYPLSHHQCARLMLARALAARPRLLAIDGLLDVIPSNELASVWSSIKKSGAPSTIVVATSDQVVLEACDRNIEFE